MAIRIELDVFSGRRNPSITLRGADADDAVARLRPSRRPRRGPAADPSTLLGYRGLVVTQVGERTSDLPDTLRVAAGQVFAPGRVPYAPADLGFEDDVCPRFPRLPSPMPDLTLQIERLRELLEKLGGAGKRRPPVTRKCTCAPLYEPDWWNVPAIQPHNNCYNYGTNYRTDTFAQPGDKGGAPVSNYVCSEVLAGAIADELVDVGDDASCPGEGHVVALVTAPGWDFHWYRKGRNGKWSHKPGPGKVTNLDNSGNEIADPRTADRGDYTDFCTFMVVHHGHIAIE